MERIDRKLVSREVAAMPRPGVFRPEVYIGGDNSDKGAWPGSGQVTKYLNYLNNWTWVRENVDGYYINNFALFAGDPPRPTNLGFLAPMANALASKNTIYETDKFWSTDDRDQLHLQELTQPNRFQQVPFAVLNCDGSPGSCNPRFTTSRIHFLRTVCGERPVLAQQGPWLVDGDFDSPAAGTWRDAIAACDGMATDSPIINWSQDTGQMQEVTYKAVVQTRLGDKFAMVMLAPNRSPDGGSYFQGAVDCVNFLEARGALPDIWAISHYDDLNVYAPATPELAADGSPGQTITGLAHWLIQRMRHTPRRVSVYRHIDIALNSHWRNVPFAVDGTILQSRHLGVLEVKQGFQDPPEVSSFPHIPGTRHALWHITPVSSGYYTIRDYVGGRHLQVDNASTGNDARVSVYLHSDPPPPHAQWMKLDRGHGWIALAPRHQPDLRLQVVAE